MAPALYSATRISVRPPEGQVYERMASKTSVSALKLYDSMGNVATCPQSVSVSHLRQIITHLGAGSRSSNVISYFLELVGSPGDEGHTVPCLREDTSVVAKRRKVHQHQPLDLLNMTGP